MRVVSVVGARSELVKCASVFRALKPQHEAQLFHTGRPFQYGTSPQFFADLGISPPDLDLGVTVGDAKSRAQTMARMLNALTPQLERVQPDWVLVHGSSNATLAGALVGAKLGIRVAHVEAGVRSYRRNTPDEMNHVVVDHLSTLHFCPTESAVRALAAEGLTEGVHNVGDVLLDGVRLNFVRAQKEISERSLEAVVGIDTRSSFAFATVHHNENTEDDARLASLVEALSRLAMPVVLPMHPQTQDSLTERPELISRIGANVHIIDPLRPLETLLTLSRATVVVTDSGGLQREAYFLGVPCITLRDDTEWVDTLDVSANTVVGANVETIVKAVTSATMSSPRPPALSGQTAFGDGQAGRAIAQILEKA